MFAFGSLMFCSEFFMIQRMNPLHIAIIPEEGDAIITILVLPGEGVGLS